MKKHSYHLIPVRMTVFKKAWNNKCLRGFEKMESSYTAGGSVNRDIYIHICMYVYTHTHTHTMEYHSFKKRWNLAICDNTNGPWGYYAKWNKSGKERGTLCFHSYIDCVLKIKNYNK